MTRHRILCLGLALLGALATTVPAWAFGSAQGTVFRLHVRASDGLVYVYLNGNRINRPACAVQPYWVIRDETSAVGKQQLALLMLAQATGRTVIIQGSGTCTRHVDGEDIKEVALEE
jgi:predicted permease